MQRQLHRPSAPAAFQCELSRFCVVFGGRWRQDVSLMTAASPRTPPLLPLNNCYKPLRLLEASRRIKFVAFGLCTGQRQCAACCRSLHSISHRSSCKLGWGWGWGGGGGGDVKPGAAGRKQWRCDNRSARTGRSNTQCNLLKLASLGLRQFQHVLHGQGVASCKSPEQKIRIKNLGAARET